MSKLYVKSIFTSIDGEYNGFGSQGELTSFIRLSGCSLKCSFCDTKYSWDTLAGKKFGTGALYDLIREKGIYKITLTGGEPLEQMAGVTDLLWILKSVGNYRVTVETNGVVPLEDILYLRQHCERNDIRIVMDYKPNSVCKITGDKAGIRSKNLTQLTHYDVLKFVIACREDFVTACREIKQLSLRTNCVLSPVYGMVDPRDLVEWMIETDVQKVPISLQIHKYIWPECVDSEVEK